jgi:hypothetical protein
MKLMSEHFTAFINTNYTNSPQVQKAALLFKAWAQYGVTGCFGPVTWRSPKLPSYVCELIIAAAADQLVANVLASSGANSGTQRSAALAAASSLPVLDLLLAALGIVEQLAADSLAAGPERGNAPTFGRWLDQRPIIWFPAGADHPLVPGDHLNSSSILAYSSSWRRRPWMIHPLDPTYNATDQMPPNWGRREWAVMGREAARLGVMLRSCCWGNIRRKSTLGLALKQLRPDLFE